MESVQSHCIGDCDETTERLHKIQTIVSKFTQEMYDDLVFRNGFCNEIAIREHAHMMYDF